MYKISRLTDGHDERTIKFTFKCNLKSKFILQLDKISTSYHRRPNKFIQWEQEKRRIIDTNFIIT
ncbi:hypothetical protein YTPLAS21_13310 [Candidatus Nitrosocosmicus sp.]|jgi:hypothetical protein|nr:hypothetical protein YTPLAS21_13310 [Candidatus Nitrosocosmicus sp.]